MLFYKILGLCGIITTKKGRTRSEHNETFVIIYWPTTGWLRIFLKLFIIIIIIIVKRILRTLRRTLIVRVNWENKIDNDISFCGMSVKAHREVNNSHSSDDTQNTATLIFPFELDLR